MEKQPQFPFAPKDFTLPQRHMPPFPKLLGTNCPPASHEASILIPHDKYDHTQYPDQ